MAYKLQVAHFDDHWSYVENPDSSEEMINNLLWVNLGCGQAIQMITTIHPGSGDGAEYRLYNTELCNGLQIETRREDTF